MDSTTLRALMKRVDAEELVLPAMQRPFVWDEERMVRLMDSLMRDFPLGSLLIWATDKDQRFRPFSRDARSTERPLDNFPRSQGGRTLNYVLDGQQRLTTLFVATHGTLDDRPLYLNVFSGDPEGKDPGETYWDFRFLSGSEAQELNERGKTSNPKRHYVRLSELCKVRPKKASVPARALARSLDATSDEEDRIVSTYSSVAMTMADDSLLNVHVVDDEKPVAEVLEIFVRVNSGGLRLQKSDLLMSLLDLSWENVQPRLVKMAHALSKDSPVDITRDMLLKTALLRVDEDPRFDRLVSQRDRIERLATPLEQAIDPVEVAWKVLRTLLRSDAGIQSRRFYRRATRALLPFATWLSFNPQPSDGEKRRLVTGLYVTLMSGVFGGAEARMAAFARGYCRVEGPFPLEELCRQVVRYRHVSGLDDLLRRHVDLTLNIAHGNVVLDDNPDELERDHVFPKASLRKEGVDQRVIDHYANLHFLRGKDNRNKTDRPPHEWFAEPGAGQPAYSDEDLEARLLSAELLKPGAFRDLLRVRGERIRAKALKLFGHTAWSFDALFDPRAAGDDWTRRLQRLLPGHVRAEPDNEAHAFTLDLGRDAALWVGRNDAFWKDSGKEHWLWATLEAHTLDDGGVRAAADVLEGLAVTKPERFEEDGLEYVTVALDGVPPSDVADALVALVEALDALEAEE